MLRKYQTDSQQVLDELFDEKLLPFRLDARNLTAERPDEFQIHFYDSRLHSVMVQIEPSDSIPDQVRAVVLRRVSDPDMSYRLRFRESH
jgi:hypothetical protein